MRSVCWGLAAAAVVALVACKSSNGGSSQVKDIESVKKVTLVQGSDAAGNAVAFITCADGWIDKAAKKAEFAVPFNKVSNLSYTEMEAIYCTEKAGGTVIVAPGGGGNNPPPAGGGGNSGDFTQLDTAVCKSQENDDLPNVTEVKRVFIAGSIGDPYDRCVVFGDELETILKTLPVIKKALIDKKVRIFATATGETFAYEDAAKKLTVPFQIKGKLGNFIEAVAPIAGGSVSKIIVFPSNKNLVFTQRQGLYGWAAAKSYCDSLGSPWKLPTTAQFRSVGSDLDEAKLKELAGTTAQHVVCNQVADGQNSFACAPLAQAAANSGNFDNMGSYCVIDAAAAAP